MPSSPRRSAAWLSVSLAALTLVAAAVSGLLIVASPTWSDAEVGLVGLVHGLHSTAGDVVALAINSAFGVGGAILVSLIVLSWILLATRSWQDTVRAGIVLVVPWACVEALKLVVRRPRPDPAMLQPMIVADPMSFSYPSGHTAFAAALCCAVVLVVLPRRTRAWSVPVAVLVVLVTAWSRVYLGVHYPTDVLAAAVVVPVVSIATARAAAAWPLLAPRHVIAVNRIS